MIARWRPVHLGHAAVLEALLDRADHLIIGIGSANRVDLRNPWSAAEVEQMLRRVVGDRAEIVPVDDLGDGPRWAEMVVGMFAPLDLFVTANPWVWSLLQDTWTLCHPVHLVPVARRLPLDGTAVRREMARGGDWARLVPPAVADWLETSGSVARFRRQYGLQTLALDAPPVDQ